MAAIHRCCIRYGKSREWAEQEMLKVFGRFSNARNTVSIWWRSRHFQEERARYGHANA
ncbi:MAG: hypothetical protein LPK02_07110 [Rhodobacterales bacterium]|nr:hypothetical protein [Rhodobacterales bacterium]